MLLVEIILCCCSDNLYGVLDWQRVGSRKMLQHYLNVDMVLQVRWRFVGLIGGFFIHYDFIQCDFILLIDCNGKPPPMDCQKIKYFGHITRHISLGKTMMQGMVAGKRSRGKPRERHHRYVWYDGISRGEEGRAGQGRGREGGEGRGLSTLSTNQNLCDRGA